MTFDPGAAALPDSGIFGLLDTPESAAAIVIPVPFSATTSYGGGANLGPDVVLDASRQVDLFDFELGRPYAPGIAMLPADSRIAAWHEEARNLAERVIAVGGVNDDPAIRRAAERVNQISEQVNALVYETCRDQLTKKKLIATLGGDHSTPFGAIRAIAEAHPGMGILHIDAHADLRHAFEGFTHSHASIMHNVMAHIPGVSSLIQVGIRDFSEDEFAEITNSRGRIKTYFDVELSRRRHEGVPWAKEASGIVSHLPEKVYVSFDIDGLDPSLCPHTGTPVPGGLSFNEATSIIATIVRSRRTIVGVDLNEVAPGPADSWDANVGARILYKLLGWMLASNGFVSPRLGA